jgi:serine phosphatase RsbU (regulator of sigma subunit)
LIQKKPVQYSCELHKNTGEAIWIQTTLTPIVDKNGNLLKVIAIDADISQLKEAEAAINQQKEELQSQGELLLEVNQKLEKSNHILTDSINYAKRIQDAMIPSEEIIKEKFEESFLFFKPKHIVSGDFLCFQITKSIFILLLPIAQDTEFREHL